MHEILDVLCLASCVLAWLLYLGVFNIVVSRSALDAATGPEPTPCYPVLHFLLGAGNPARTRPATEALIRAHIADWSKDPYVLGCYSHPSLGAHVDDR